MNSILKYIILTAMRDWLYVGLLAILIIAICISILLGSTALVEQNQMTITYIACASRMILVVGIILFSCFYMRRSFDNKEVEFILSKAISRWQFILSYLLGFITVALIILLPLILILFFFPTNKLGLFYWAISLVFEMLIIITFSILAGLILRSAVSAILAALGFYIISRMMGFFVLTIKFPESISQLTTINNFLQFLLKIISIAFPRLDLFSKSDWLIYGINNFSDIIIISVQSAIYVPLMIFMAFHDLNKKQF